MKKNRLTIRIDRWADIPSDEVTKEAERLVVGRLFRDKETGRIYRGHFVQLLKVWPPVWQNNYWTYHFECFYVPLDVTETTLEDA